MKFGTQLEDALIINHSKFGVSISNSIVPPNFSLDSLAHAGSNANQNVNFYMSRFFAM